MNIHEYQSKDLLKRYGIPIPMGQAAFTVPEAVAAADAVRAATRQDIVVVKAQIHAGGRGKGGGVKVVKDPAQVGTVAGAILGMQLITHQTGPEGKKVRRLLVEQGVEIKKELYLAVVLDRAQGRVTVIASTEGGMDIEEVAHKTPERIFRQTLDPAVGFRPWQAREICFALGLHTYGP